MNSDIINQIIHIINPTANNSANYIKLIPYIEPSSMLLDEISETVDRIVKLSENKDAKTIKQMEDKIDSMITSIYLEPYHKVG